MTRRIILVVHPDPAWTAGLSQLGLPYEFKTVDAATVESTLTGVLPDGAIVFHSDRTEGQDNFRLLTTLNAHNVPTILLSPDQDTVDRLVCASVVVGGFARPFTTLEVLAALNENIPPWEGDI
jgi:hypothetical protein